eukprot:g5153.t1
MPSTEHSMQITDEVEEEIAEESFVTNQITVVWSLLSLTVCLTYWLQKYRFSRILPPSIAAMVLGMFVGLITNSIDSLSPPRFSPTAFLYGLLPPIVFSAGFSMKKRAFFKNFGSIITFAVVGTVISTLVFSGCTILLMKLGFVDEGKLGEDPQIKIFLYGSLISAIDPVATLSVFSDLDAPPLLYNLVFGESVLNDAVSIVLFRTFQGLLGAEIDSHTILNLVAKFCWISFGSLLVGIVVALGCAFVLKRFTPSEQEGGHSDGVIYEISIVFMGAYLAYLLAEAISFSGIVALFFSGIVHAHYSFHNITSDSQVAISKVATVLGFLCEIFVFEYLGLQVALIESQSIDLGILISGIPLCLISRGANIFPLAYLANKFRSNPIPYPVQAMQFTCGLRGAVSYALSAYLSKLSPSDSVETGTLVIVVLSTILFGGMTGPLMRLLHLQGVEDHEIENLGYNDMSQNPEAELQRVHREGNDHGGRDKSLESRWELIDNRFLKPYFGGRSPDANHEENGLLRSVSSEHLENHGE